MNLGDPNPSISHLRLDGGVLALVVLMRDLMAEALLTYTAFRQLSQFLAAIIVFHSSEFALAAFFHGRSNVSFSSLLISKQYAFAMAGAVLEYAIEIRLFPNLKEHWWISNTGLVMMLVGELIRKVAIVTAGRSFTHIIRKYHEERHELITHGIYSEIQFFLVLQLSRLSWTVILSRFMRHPSYSGFFIWAAGTQVMLCNPVCTITFIVVVWRFFFTRIPYEEFFLRQFFGSQYVEYGKRVPSGLPFIR